MTTKVVLDVFPKQVGEDRFVDVSVQKFLTNNAETLDSGTPYEVVMPVGLTLVADSIFDNVVKLLIRGGVHNKKYLVVVWFNMLSTAKIKHEFYVMVQNQPC